MVNSKKMSKSTVAIILLSLLLCLSLILTATGAWFTDSTGADYSGSISFGTVQVDYTGSAAWTLSADNATKALPGDTMTVTGTLDFSNSNDDDGIYVLVSIDAEAAEAIQNYVTTELKITFAEGITTVTGVAVDPGYAFYHLTAEQAKAAKAVAVSGGVKISTEMPNYDTTTQFNGGTGAHEVKMVFGVSVIQASHMTDAQAAYNLLKAGVSARVSA